MKSLETFRFGRSAEVIPYVDLHSLHALVHYPPLLSGTCIPYPRPHLVFLIGFATGANRQPAVAPLDDTIAYGVLSTAFSFNSLNNALESAHDQVRTLRKQYDELQALVSKKFGKGWGRPESSREGREEGGLRLLDPSRLQGQATPHVG
ncbi:hypothetical protein V8B97DRAFT_1979954 [Scleroderma yunnanense]